VPARISSSSPHELHGRNGTGASGRFHHAKDVFDAEQRISASDRRIKQRFVP
jgi:hypothetical protein